MESFKIINNEDFEKALENIDNKLIIEAACSPFRHLIDKDELYRCKLISLWKAMLLWKPDGGSKFTSILFKQTRWNCIQEINRVNRRKYYSTDVDFAIEDPDDIEELLEPLSLNLRTVIKQRFIDGMTLREIAQKHNICPETARKRINFAINSLKSYYYQKKDQV